MDARANRGALDAVGKERLRERIRKRDVTLIDVRPAEEFRAAHIAGALSVSLEELEASGSALAMVAARRPTIAAGAAGSPTAC